MLVFYMPINIESKSNMATVWDYPQIYYFFPDVPESALRMGKITGSPAEYTIAFK